MWRSVPVLCLNWLLCFWTIVRITPLWRSQAVFCVADNLGWSIAALAFCAEDHA